MSLSGSEICYIAQRAWLGYQSIPCLHERKKRLTPPPLGDMVSARPVGPALNYGPDARLCGEAADALAATIVNRLGREVAERGHRTFPLPLPEPHRR